ncbi:GNAT family N-acetyltransferase [Vibrio sp. Isolate31]|uniref:GNAT family N-acetyltransferase n=1 Tax=unclassified Vibrio TaxID=2614977 RepID=UPI001EFE05E7|nr:MULTISPECIES: GNAT family N-acetyltransferase [unclassified Vibrio]MCG9553434.1 GNAT family N-acetyltransferase [Vibrio sp. Isolate32]MCG9602529.1 GNAT family N-acetyltransferase [Vibrio sp. Isolate31]
MINHDKFTLTPLSVGHAQAMFEVVQQEREYLSRYLYWVDEVKDVDTMTRYIQQRVGFPENVARWYTIWVDDKIAGVFGIRTIDEHRSSSEVAYWLTREAQGHNITCICIEQAKAQLKQEHGIRTLEIHCLQGNAASQHIAKKCGGQLKKVSPSYCIQDGVEQNLLIYHLST